jgi:hypothetical protein
MGKTTNTRYEVAEHLRTPEDMAAYLEACLEEAKGDAALILKTLGHIARDKGMLSPAPWPPTPSQAACSSTPLPTNTARRPLIQSAMKSI